MKNKATCFWLIILLLALTSCDWEYYALLNSIPIHGDPDANPTVYVYLGVDGVSYYAAKEAIERGAFSGENWNLAKSIAVFPAVSNISWTRIMHTEPVDGYEYQYYNPDKDKVYSKGVWGVLKHNLPFGSLLPCYQTFDYWGNGYAGELYAYTHRWYSYSNTLDNIFSLLDGRVETASSFSAYIVETDIMGHLDTREDVIQAIMVLSRRIEQFKRNHSDRNIVFTVFSDHGMDFIHVPDNKFVKFDNELEKVGVVPVYSLKNRDPKKSLFAVPIIYVRTTYIALHTVPEIIEQVAERVSTSETVDLAISKTAPPEQNLFENESDEKVEWFKIWMQGERAVFFGFNSDTDEYYLPSEGEYEKIDMELEFMPEEKIKALSDEELFEMTKDRKYPDIFYRTRTALSPVGIKYPADVIVSLKHPYASCGISLPTGSDDSASSGFHGAMDYLGTNGILLTEERDMPETVRADTILSMFPKLKEHIEDNHKLTIYEGDVNESLEYDF